MPKIIQKEILAQDDQILIGTNKKVKVVLENTKVKFNEDPVVQKTENLLVTNRPLKHCMR